VFEAALLEKHGLFSFKNLRIMRRFLNSDTIFAGAVIGYNGSPAFFQAARVHEKKIDY